MLIQYLIRLNFTQKSECRSRTDFGFLNEISLTRKCYFQAKPTNECTPNGIFLEKTQ